MPDQTSTYLGDSVYAEYDGVHVKLRLNHHLAYPVIFLDDHVMEALIEFYKSKTKTA